MAELKKLGRYQLRRVLGKGAMGVVYEGFDPTLGRRVAVKTILKSAAIDEETAAAYSARFVREAQAAGRLNHPNIVQVHDFAEEGEVAYLVMEFIQGRELRSYFDAGEAFGAAETVRIMGELLDALEFAHEAGVIHRDVKPANVMLDVQRRVKLADFGVARIQESDRSLAGTMVGTPAFMSPEQIQGGKIDRRTDIFSAGTILYQLLTGEQPFKGEGVWTVAKSILEDDPPRPSEIAASVSPVFDEVVDKALAKNPSQRFASAREFAAALRGALASVGQRAPVAAKPKPRPETRASEAEVEFWRAIQASSDPAEFEFYLEQFSQGTYAQLARHKIAKLREPLEKAQKEAAEKAQREAAETARREAEEKQRREAEERARKETEERQRREAEEQAKQAALEKARREAEEKARRKKEEQLRQAEALKAQEQARARAPAADEEATVAIGGSEVPGRKKPVAVAAIIAAIAVAGGVAAYALLKRVPAPVPVAEKPAPPTPEAPAVDPEKIRREAEERIRREQEEKAAAEQAAAAKVAAEKALAEKQAAAKAAAEKAAAEKAAAEKAAQEKAAALRAAAEKAAAEKAAAERVAAERAAQERAAAEKAAAEKAAAERAAAQKLAAEKAAAEKGAAEKAAAAKAAAATKPGWPSVGDRWVYEARDADRPEKRYQVVVEVQAVSPSSIRDVFRPADGPAVTLTHQARAHLIGVAPGIASFSPYLRAFQELRAGERWTGIEFRQLGLCSSHPGVDCNASARVASKERAAVRAGTYDSWKIVVELRIRDPWGRPVYGEYIFWYAEEPKRVVKYQSRVRHQTPGFPWLEPNIDMELVSYIPAGTAK